MSPNKISMLLSVHVRGELIYGLTTPGTQAFDDARKWLKANEYIEPVEVIGRPMEEEPDYRTTKKGRVYIKALEETPEPVVVWAMPPHQGG